MNTSSELITVYRQMNDRLSTIAAYPLLSSNDERSYEALLTQTLSAQAASAARAVRLLRELSVEPEVQEVMLRYQRCLLLANGSLSSAGVIAGADWRVVVSQSERLPAWLSSRFLEAWQVQAAWRASRERALRVWGMDSGRSASLVAAEEYELAMDLWQGLCAVSGGSGYDRALPVRQAVEEILSEGSRG